MTLCIAAGLTMSVQDTVRSDLAFAAIVHLGQTIPRKLLRCVLESRDMVLVKTADGDFPVIDGRVTAPATPGLGVTPVSTSWARRSRRTGPGQSRFSNQWCANGSSLNGATSA